MIQLGSLVLLVSMLVLRAQTAGDLDWPRLGWLVVAALVALGLAAVFRTALDLLATRTLLNDLGVRSRELERLIRLVSHADDRGEPQVGVHADLAVAEAQLLAARHTPNPPKPWLSPLLSYAFALASIAFAYEFVPAVGAEPLPDPGNVPDVEVVEAASRNATRRAVVRSDALARLPSDQRREFFIGEDGLLYAGFPDAPNRPPVQIQATFLVEPSAESEALCRDDQDGALGGPVCLFVEDPPEASPPDAGTTGPDAGVPASRSLDQLRARCVAMRASACYELAVGLERAGHLREAVTTYTSECERGNRHACQRVGWLYARGAPDLPRDEARAASAYSNACDVRHAAACFGLALLYLRGPEDIRDPARAVDLLGLACAARQANACDLLGTLNQRGTAAGRPDPERARHFHDQACGLNDPSGCANLAFLFASGRGVRRDDGEATRLYKKACDMRSGVACHSLAYFVEAHRADGIEASPTELRRRACSYGYDAACPDRAGR